MKIILIILLYCLIGATIEFLLVFGVLMYAKRHSNSDEQFIEAWNKASDLALISSLHSTEYINRDIADIFKIQILTGIIGWPIRISVTILLNIGIYMYEMMDHFFNTLTSILVKR